MRALIRLAAAAVTVTASTITNAASFDCTKAKSLTEKLVCSDADLSSRDESLAAVFARAKATSRDPVEFQREARAAWNWREKNCRDVECLRQWFAERTSLYADRSEGYSNRAPANPDLSVKPSPQRVSAAQLYYAYRNNAFAADSNYMGKELSVDSVILNIIKTDGGDPVLLLGYGSHEPHAVAKFDKSSIPQIATLGQQVAIRAECIGGGMLNNLPLLFCQTAKRM